MCRLLKKYFVFIVGAFFCSLFLVLAFTTDRKNDNSVTAKAEASYNQTTTAFIDSIGETARQIGQGLQCSIAHSVLIAPAILESNSGQSGLSQAPYYNFFGIKGSYNGNSVTMRTWEDDGTGNTYEIDEPFRSYGSLSDSLADYAALMTSSTYSGTWKSNTSSYADATQTLTGTYATDSLYASKLNSIIAYYGLTIYDQAPVTQATGSSSGLVWNSYRGSYTDAETLSIDVAWASYKNYK
ncbi:MAG: glucosaminidase domain-containing protein [Streptococcus thermophilus]